MTTPKEPFHTPTQQQRDIVTRAIKAGLDSKTIASLLDITVPALTRAYPRELLSGSERIMEVVDALYQRATEGNVPAIKLFLECRAGWIPKEKEAEIASLAEPLIIRYHRADPPPDPAPKADPDPADPDSGDSAS